MDVLNAKVEQRFKNNIITDADLINASISSIRKDERPNCRERLESLEKDRNILNLS